MSNMGFRHAQNIQMFLRVHFTTQHFHRDLWISPASVTDVPQTELNQINHRRYRPDKIALCKNKM